MSDRRGGISSPGHERRSGDDRIDAVGEETVRIGAIAFVLLLGLACRAGPPGASGAMAQDARLARSVTLCHSMVPLGRLLEELGTELEVPLTTDPAIKDETVFVIARSRPAAEVLEELANALGYHWSSFRSDGGDPGYRLYQSREAQNEERRRAAAYRRERTRDLHHQVALGSTWNGLPG
jgi:hypothetical protein